MSFSIEINGVDEAGRIGQNIIFSRVSVERDFEINLMLHNLSSFSFLIPNKNIINGYDKKSLVQYVRYIIENETYKTSIYKMSYKSQAILLRILYGFLSEELFELRGRIINQYQERDWGVIQTALDTMNRFKRREILAESFVKAFGMKNR